MFTNIRECYNSVFTNNIVMCYTSHVFRSGFLAVKNTFSLVKFYYFLTMNGTAPTVRQLYKHTPVQTYSSCVFFVQ